jgi:type I restriction enzyme S subunit
LASAVCGLLTEDWRKKNNFKVSFNLSNHYEINEDYRELFEIPENWQWVALGNYAKCNRGRFSIRPRNDPRYYGGEIPFIQIGDLPKEGGFISSHSQTLNEKGLAISKLFSKNTLVIAIVGATIANTGILNYDMCFPDSLVGINLGNLSLNLFLDYYIRIEKNNFRQLSYAGGGQPNIKLELLNNYPFPLPPAEEQYEIVNRIEKYFAFADRIESRYLMAKAQFDKLPQSILAKAFRGELVSQDPNDEPASELLKRIKSEKAKSKK